MSRRKNNDIWAKNKNKKRARAWVLGVKSDPKLSFYFEWPKLVASKKKYILEINKYELFSDQVDIEYSVFF